MAYLGPLVFCPRTTKTPIIIQENQLFDETIYENIKIGKLDATKSEILNACDISYVKEFSDNMPKKLYTKVEMDLHILRLRST